VRAEPIGPVHRCEFHEGFRSAGSAHLTFGRGVRYRLGAPLARLESRTAIWTLFFRPSVRKAFGGYVGIMQDFGEDIVLLAMRRDGTIAVYDKLRFALAGSALVRLAATRRIDIDHDGYISVLDASPTGDPITDLLLSALDGAVRRPRAKEWVAGQPGGLVTRVLERLTETGAIRIENRRVFGVFRTRRWVVVDEARRAAAKRRLDVIARSTGPITVEQAAFAGLAHAVGLGAALYRTRENRAARNRLEAIFLSDENVVLMGTGRPGSSDDGTGDVDTLIPFGWNASMQSATMAAIHSSVDATHHAVVEHYQLAHDGGSHHDGGSSHHDGGGMAGGHHG
jgi:hypothetical protein